MWLTKEHPISKEWAKRLPPLQEKFAVTRDVLFKFLVEPLKPEIQDIHSRVQRRLHEPKSIQQEYDESLLITPEHKYYCGLCLLEQFNDKYLNSLAETDKTNRDESCVYMSNAKLLFDKRRRELLFEKIQEIVEQLYQDSASKQLHQMLIANFKEVAEQFIKNHKALLDSAKAEKMDESIEKLLKYMDSASKRFSEKRADKELKNEIVKVNTLETKSKKDPVVLFQLAPFATFKPKICSLSNGWDLPLQNEISLEPMEYKKIDLGVKIILPKGYCALNKQKFR